MKIVFIIALIFVQISGFAQQNCESARKKYLQMNPDVANAKLDAWYHYLKYGIDEGRDWYECESQIFYEKQAEPQIFSEILDLNSLTFNVEKIKRLKLSSIWDENLIKNKRMKILHSSFELDNKEYKILLIYDFKSGKPVFNGKKLNRNINLGEWFFYIDGKKIGSILIHKIENGKISEYRFTCLQYRRWEPKNNNLSQVQNNRWYEKRGNEIYGEYWAYSWKGDYYFGENPILSKTKESRCQIIFYNGDLFEGYVNRDFEIMNKGKYFFNTHPLYLKYEGRFFENKFDDSKNIHDPSEKSDLYLKNGKKINGKFISGVIKTNEKYHIKYPNGDVYYGYITKEFKRHGEGKLRYPNGNIFLGNWYDDNINGDGKILYNDGQVIEGFWGKNVLEKYHGEKVIHHILPSQAYDKIRIHKSKLEDFTPDDKNQSTKINFQDKLTSERLVEIINIFDHKKLKSQFTEVYNERASGQHYVCVIKALFTPSNIRYVAEIVNSDLIVIKFNEIHSNKLLNYSIHAKSFESKINNGNFDGEWTIKTNFGYEYDIKLDNGEVTYTKYKDNRMSYEVERKTINNSKVFEGTYTELIINNDKLVHKGIWNAINGTKIYGLHLLNGDSLYLGNYKNDKRHGYGISTLTDKEFIEKGYLKYEGEWCSNQIYGEGKMLMKNDYWKRGYWNRSNEFPSSMLPAKFERPYKRFNNNLSVFEITSGNQIEVVDKILSRRATSPYINRLNTSAIQSSNGVIYAEIIVPRKTGYIYLKKISCSNIIYGIDWSDGSNENIYLDERGQIFKIE